MIYFFALFKEKINQLIYTKFLIINRIKHSVKLNINSEKLKI